MALTGAGLAGSGSRQGQAWHCGKGWEQQGPDHVGPCRLLRTLDFPLGDGGLFWGEGGRGENPGEKGAVPR